MPRIGVFRCDESLNVGRVHGEIADRLRCDSNELYGQQWREFLHRDDFQVVERAAVDIAQRRVGTYSVCAVARNQERLYLAITTRIVYDGTAYTGGGSLLLEAWESPRAFVDLKPQEEGR